MGILFPLQQHLYDFIIQNYIWIRIFLYSPKIGNFEKKNTLCGV